MQKKISPTNIFLCTLFKISKFLILYLKFPADIAKNFNILGKKIKKKCFQ